MPHVTDRPLVGLQAPGLSGDEPLPADLDELVTGTSRRCAAPTPTAPTRCWAGRSAASWRTGSRRGCWRRARRWSTCCSWTPTPTRFPIEVDPHDTSAALAAYREAQGGSVDALLDLLGPDGTQRLARGVAAVGDALRAADEAPTIVVPTTLVAATPGPTVRRWPTGGRPSSARGPPSTSWTTRTST